MLLPEYHIHRFMYGLGLKPAAFLVYAVLYSFTIGERGLYYGSQKYLAESLNMTVRTYQNTIKELELKGLIERCESEDGKYKGLRCVSQVKLGNDNKPRVVVGEKQREFLAELTRKIEERKAEEQIKAEEERQRKEKERAEQLARVDEICERVRAKIASGEIRKQSVGTSPSDTKKPDSDLAMGDIIFDEMLSSAAPQHEKNTLIMMKKYEQPGDRRRFLSFGKQGRVIMTEPQYKRLLSLLPTEELLPYLVKLENMLEENLKTGRKPPHSHYHTLKKWIEEDLSE